MLITTHTVATISLGRLMNLVSPRDWLMAFLFGVLIDIDHLKILRPGLRRIGFLERLGDGKSYCRSFLQEPISFFWVMPLSFYLKTPIPAVFFALHVFLDYLVDGVKKPFWPISDFTLKKGVFPCNSIWEIRLSLLFLLLLLASKP